MLHQLLQNKCLAVAWCNCTVQQVCTAPSVYHWREQWRYCHCHIVSMTVHGCCCSASTQRSAALHTSRGTFIDCLWAVSRLCQITCTIRLHSCWMRVAGDRSVHATWAPVSVCLIPCCCLPIKAVLVCRLMSQQSAGRAGSVCVCCRAHNRICNTHLLSRPPCENSLEDLVNQ